jgi:hypothetical protein
VRLISWWQKPVAEEAAHLIAARGQRDTGKIQDKISSSKIHPQWSAPSNQVILDEVIN